MFSLLRMTRLFDVGCSDPSASATPAPTSKDETTAGVDAGCSISGAKEAWTFGDNTIVKQSDNWMRVH